MPERAYIELDEDLAHRVLAMVECAALDCPGEVRAEFAATRLELIDRIARARAEGRA